MGSATVCRGERFTDRMGVATAHGDIPTRVLEDAVAYAKSSGYGRADATELQRVFDGTHADTFRVPSLSQDVSTLCPVWLEGVLPQLPASLEDLLMDGRPVTAFACSDHLRLCPEHSEEL